MFLLESSWCLQVQRKQQSGQIRCLLEVPNLISASNWSCFFHEKCSIMKANWKVGDSPSHTYTVFDWDSALIGLIVLNLGLKAVAEWTWEMFTAVISIADFVLLPTAASSNHCLCGYRKISVYLFAYRLYICQSEKLKRIRLAISTVHIAGEPFI